MENDLVVQTSTITSTTTTTITITTITVESLTKKPKLGIEFKVS